jgi:hypothetical protein
MRACELVLLRSQPLSLAKMGQLRAADDGRDAIDGNQAITFNAVQFAS